MKIQLHMQPKNHHTCGQYCVAMIVKTKPSYVMGRARKYSSTRIFEVKRMLRSWGLNTAERAKPYKNYLPDLCLLRLTYPNIKMGHFVVYSQGIIYCPDSGISSFNDYNFLGGSIKSYLEILN